MGVETMKQKTIRLTPGSEQPVQLTRGQLHSLVAIVANLSAHRYGGGTAAAKRAEPAVLGTPMILTLFGDGRTVLQWGLEPGPNPDFQPDEGGPVN
jgi:hypothetical protein